LTTHSRNIGGLPRWSTTFDEDKRKPIPALTGGAGRRTGGAELRSKNQFQREL
jgi:hypothetical protein